MKFLFLVTVLAHATHGGNVGLRTSNLLAPAGVTYVDGSYHAGLAAGPLAYSASVAQPVYQSAAVAAAPAVAVASQPVATKYAAVPTVQHVPGVAEVPFTRIDAQPAVIQKTIDVARPAVKTQRYEVRRPAIQKQFYDIEERVVVRPAGSAVLELDEPLSKTQKSAPVIRPTGDAVAVSSAVAVPAAPAVAVQAALPSVSAVSPAPAELPSVEINLARSSLPAVGPAPLPSVGFARSSIAAAPVSLPSVGIARSSFVAAPAPSLEVRTSIPTASPAPLPSVGVARSSFVAAPAPAPAPAPSLEVRTSIPTASPAPIQSVGLARTAYVASTSAALPSAEIRSSFSAPAPTQVQSVSYSAPFTGHSVGISSIPVKTVSVSSPVHTATITGVSSISSGVSGISSVSAGPSEVSFSTPAPQYEQTIQSTPEPQLSDDSVSIESADFSLARSSGLARSYPGPQTFTAAIPAPAPVPARASVPTHESIFRSEVSPRRFPTQPAPSARGSLLVNYPSPIDLIPQSRFRSGPVYSSGNLQSEINHNNQQKYIQLLTARGEVSEIAYGRSGSASYPVDAGQVRARVLSATPAPAYASPAEERVNTRRVVVNRPVETLQEVEVNEPVTKFERVRVDQPAVVKTASQDVVRVPTSVPVYGKTLAPIAEAPVAYSADWQ